MSLNRQPRGFRTRRSALPLSLFPMHTTTDLPIVPHGLAREPAQSALPECSGVQGPRCPGSRARRSLRNSHCCGQPSTLDRRRSLPLLPTPAAPPDALRSSAGDRWLSHPARHIQRSPAPPRPPRHPDRRPSPPPAVARRSPTFAALLLADRGEVRPRVPLRRSRHTLARTPARRAATTPARRDPTPSRSPRRGPRRSSTPAMPERGSECTCNPYLLSSRSSTMRRTAPGASPSNRNLLTSVPARCPDRASSLERPACSRTDLLLRPSGRLRPPHREGTVPLP